MGAIILSLRFAAATLILLTAFQLIRGSRNLRFNQGYFVLASCMLVYLFTPYFFEWPGAEFSWPIPLPLGILFDASASATPAVFAAFTIIVFQDRLPPRWMILTAGAMLILDAVAFACNDQLCTSTLDITQLTLVTFLFDQFPHLLRVLFIVLSVLWTLDGWTGDLVEARRRFRGLFLAIQGLLIVTVVVLENFIPAHIISPESSLLFNSVLIFLSALLITLFFLEPKQDVIQQLTQHTLPIPDTAATKTSDLPAADIEVTTLHQLLEEQKIYRRADLTIGALAAQMSMPEYKLRSLINRQLKFRNFNELLNQYRIEDAAEQLRNPSAKPLPILTIAMDVGYRSLSTFNKAFKATHNQTPSAYRRDQSNRPED